MTPTNPLDMQYAPAAVRDQFLLALDGQDTQLPMRLATELATCANPLPSMTCRLLDLPFGSTYGSAARRVLARSRSGLPIIANGESAQVTVVTPTSSPATPPPAPVA